MSQTPRPRPPRRAPSSPPSRSDSDSDGTNIPKPYKLITFPKERPKLQRPAGHHKYYSDRLHGTLFLTLKVQTSLHVSTGVVAMGSDIGSDVPLIKTMTTGAEQKLLIQGSSLKGCIRSVYEAITRSCICKTKADRNTIPDGYRECKIDRKRNKVSVCDSCQIFGAMDWQGLLDFNDARCENSGYDRGFMPSLYAPRTQRPAYYTKGMVAGRKFYYHTIRAIDKGQNQGITVQQAAKEYTFTTQLHFRNLQPAELGTLLIVLGQDPKYPIALKVGGGKPIGMGTMTATVTEISAFADNQQRANEFKLPMLKQRYSSYTPTEPDSLTGNNLQKFIEKTIKSAHSTLIQKSQLEQLTEVLRYPTDREPPTGMY
ncbi:MAG: RAMP superfamily CRISPR-associated protein [Coleofasciculaceae cyanobacterium]